MFLGLLKLVFLFYDLNISSTKSNKDKKRKTNNGERNWRKITERRPNLFMASRPPFFIACPADMNKA